MVNKMSTKFGLKHFCLDFFSYLCKCICVLHGDMFCNITILLLVFYVCCNMTVWKTKNVCLNPIH